jgi:hypothetical protein
VPPTSIPMRIPAEDPTRYAVHVHQRKNLAGDEARKDDVVKSPLGEC